MNILKNKKCNIKINDKELQDRFDNLTKEHIDTITRNEDYRDRIDRAIEYIKEAEKNPRGMGLEPLDEIYAMNIIDILRGYE